MNTNKTTSGSRLATMTTAILLALTVNIACGYALSHDRTAGQRYVESSRHASTQLASNATIASE